MDPIEIDAGSRHLTKRGIDLDDEGTKRMIVRRAIFGSAALALTLAPIASQAAPRELSRTGVELGGSEQLGRGSGWLLIAVVLGLAIFGIMELTGDDEPTSP